MKDAYKVKKDPVLGEFYNKRQHAFKIKLNDVYGCFAQNGWRYTDGYKVISNAITLTGQRLIQESIKEKKGNNRPFNNLEDRLEFLKAIKYITDIEEPCLITNVWKLERKLIV